MTAWTTESLRAEVNYRNGNLRRAAAGRHRASGRRAYWRELRLLLGGSDVR